MSGNETRDRKDFSQAGNTVWSRIMCPEATGGTKAPAWTVLKLPIETRKKHPLRGIVSVKGYLNGVAFESTLSPDGQEHTGSSWRKGWYGAGGRGGRGRDTGDCAA